MTTLLIIKMLLNIVYDLKHPYYKPLVAKKQTSPFQLLPLTFCHGPGSFCLKRWDQPESLLIAEIKGQLCSLDSSDQRLCWRDATLTSSIIDRHQVGASTASVTVALANKQTQKQGAVLYTHKHKCVSNERVKCFPLNNDGTDL